MHIRYDKILKESFAVAKHNRRLWLFGIAVSLFSGSGLNLRLPSGLTSVPEGETPDIQNTADVLGAVSEAVRNPSDLIPPSFLVLLVFLAILVVLIWIAVSLIVRGWSSACLIQGIRKSSGSIGEISSSGRSNAFKFLVTGLLLSLFVFLLVVVPVIIFSGLSYLLYFQKALFVIWLMVFAAAGIPSFLAVLVFSGIVSAVSERIVVYEGRYGIDALKEAWRLTVRNILPFFIIGILNTFISSFAGCLSIVLLGVVLIIPALTVFLFWFVFKAYLLAAVLSAFILLMFVYAVTFINGLISVFKFANWNKIYEEIKNG